MFLFQLITLKIITNIDVVGIDVVSVRTVKHNSGVII